MIIRLLAWKSGPDVNQSLAASTKVKVELLETENIRKIIPEGTGSKILYYEEGGIKEYHVFENPTQVMANYDLTQTGTQEAAEITLGGDAAGSTQGNGLDILTYYTTIDAATDTSAEAIDFTAAVVGDVYKVVNLTAVALEAFPASGGTINGAAANAKYDHPANTGVYYYCQVAGALKVLPF